MTNYFPMPIVVIGATIFEGTIDNKNISSGKLDCLGNLYDPNDNYSNAAGTNEKFGYCMNKYSTSPQVVTKIRFNGHFPVKVTALCSINKSNQIEIKDVQNDFTNLIIDTLEVPKAKAN